MCLNLNPRLLSLTWGYLLYQEIKAHVAAFGKHNTEVECCKHLCSKARARKQRALHITHWLALGQQLITVPVAVTHVIISSKGYSLPSRGSSKKVDPTDKHVNT